MLNDCRECNAGLYQASQMNIGWRCPVHGVEQLQVAQILMVVGDLREENARLRAACQMVLATYDAWYPDDIFIGGPESDDGVNELVANRNALRDALGLVASPAAGGENQQEGT